MQTFIVVPVETIDSSFHEALEEVLNSNPGYVYREVTEYGGNAYVVMEHVE